MSAYSLSFVSGLNDVYTMLVDKKYVRKMAGDIVEHAVKAANVPQDVHVILPEQPTFEFEQLLLRDKGHLSIGTAIDKHGVYFSPMNMVWKYRYHSRVME